MVRETNPRHSGATGPPTRPVCGAQLQNWGSHDGGYGKAGGLNIRQMAELCILTIYTNPEGEVG